MEEKNVGTINDLNKVEEKGKRKMFQEVNLKNFGPLKDFKWDSLKNINLIIGKNGSGKTFLLKALYTAVKTIEANKRGQEHRSPSEILVDKLYWTFQERKIGDLVTRGAEGPLEFMTMFDGKNFIYKFGKDTMKEIKSIEYYVEPRDENSIFLPAKEVVSIYGIIAETREDLRAFGFDDTYRDLAEILSRPLTRGRNYEVFSSSRSALIDIIDGKLEFDEKAKVWMFKRGNQKFSIGVTSEGVKKIGILDTLLGNRYITPGSIIFIDEPDAALHPTAVGDLLRIIAKLSSDIQFFLASHSYFVIKNLYLIARTHNIDLPIISLDDTISINNLKEGIPKNPIIEESIELYRKDVELGFK